MRMDISRGHAFSWKGLFAVVVWGASFAATRVALQSFNPFGLIAIRQWMGVAMLVLVIKIRRGPLIPIRRDLPACIFLGLILAAHLLIQAYGLLYTSAIKTGWIIGFIPVTIAVGAYLLRQQTLSGTGWLGVATGTAGIVFVWLSSSPDFAQARFGDLLQIVSCLTWTVYTLISGPPVSRNGVLCVTTFGMAVAGAVTTLAMLGTGVLAGPITSDALLATGFLGIACGGLAYYCWFAAVEEHGPTRVGALLYIEPFVAVAAGPALVHEKISASVLVGGLGVLAGVWLVARGSRRPTMAAEQSQSRE
jgi:drug/metabolite transporter (DMT)-like permease